MRVLSFFILFISSFVFAQKKVPNDYFMNPLDIPLATSGTFGELRSNHFHSGIDLKTQKREGLNVYAAASGRISRIKVSRFGYGKALYLTHPNGYTTVYAHLKKFAPEIEAYVKKKQYTKESYQIELFPKSESFKIKKGDIIGYSGNTGGSGGPHLHFEIRDSSARPMNPMSFGIDVKDSKKPIINSVWVYTLGNNTHVNGHQKPQRLTLSPQKDGTYTASKIHAIGNIGIGISTIDQQDLTTNKNGIFSIETFVNGQKNFSLEMNRFSFAETRYINRLIDFSYYKQNSSRISKLFIERNNPLSIYKDVLNKGVITIQDSLSYSITIKVKDFKQNTSTIVIPVDGKQVDNVIKNEILKTPYYAKPSQNFTYSANGFNLLIPKGSLYEDVFLDITTKGDTIKVHNSKTPLHKKMTLVFDVSKYTEKDRKKLFIGRVNNRKPPSYQTTSKKGSKFSLRTKSFGTYGLFSDTKKPTIVPINVADKKWMTQAQYLKLKINDSETGIFSYRGTINGKFILMEYDYKTGMLVYDFNDKIINASENKFKLIVLDKVGNKSTYEATFFRKP
ncbi:M23 family metallopeptidase [Aquimarina hainanensis]|uniref:M23 family metallopeptidase n=2 Tax=Aquimarina hainanensis TaxID=1578017 RepID=A0ABW5NGE4_9FLAO